VASHKAMVYEFLKVATLSWEPTYKSHLYTRIATLYDDKTWGALGHFIRFQMNKWIRMCKVSSKNVRLGHIRKMHDLTQLLPHPTPLIFSPTLCECSPNMGPYTL
jgi:hypothetical protein